MKKKEMKDEAAAKQCSSFNKYQLTVAGTVANCLKFSPKKQARLYFVPIKDFGGQIIDFVWQQKSLTLSQKAIWRQLALFAGENGVCFPSQRLLAERAGVHERTVRKALLVMEQRGFIEKHRPQERRSCSYFFVFHPVFFKLLLSLNMSAQRAIYSGPESLNKRPAIPAIPIAPKDKKNRTTTGDGSGSCLASSSGELSEEVEEMILVVSQVKDCPQKWAFIVRERFRRGVGDLESLKKQFEELEAKSRSSYEGWAGLLEKVISRDGIDRFTSIIDKMTGTHLQIKGETIPMSYVVDYLGDIK